ncbi:hypothetical protein GCM10011415_16580 [Salipiger pallidus]|uniref:NlpC/P60 domain-containing protein n=1 Tax=Salipiger pallidus TaxID=1775170 RepID=A0A8J2ZJ28_9RHOB|nr:NlpC/P60 family protein [Salipiger pallidus]GGG69780.1 hypothetical protein GCM10011415_16580 [Salipiger pallidus]
MDARERPANDRVVTRALAERFPDLRPVDPRAFRVSAPVADLAMTPGGARERQLRYGAVFDVLDERDGAVFGYAPAEEYAGWLAADTVRPAVADDEAQTIVLARQTHVYGLPDMKTPERLALPHLSRLRPTGQTEGRFTETELGWVPTAHLGAATQDADPVAVAALYLGTPYLWGGNSAFGIDCSGLVQAALAAFGQPCPGDSDLQAAQLGETLGPDTSPQRGDLLFWQGHVAWVSGPDEILHANAHHMAVAYEGLAAAVDRIATQGDGPVTRHARLHEVKFL